MSARDQFAPSWLPRQQRRWIDRQLRALHRRGVCSLCGGSFKHNSQTATGFDAQGNVAVACECCIDRLAKIFAIGFYSDRQYDFLSPRSPASDGPPELPPERIVEAFAARAKAIAETDKLLADAEQRGGGIRAGTVVTRDYPWKSDDKLWFEQHPQAQPSYALAVSRRSRRAGGTGPTRTRSDHSGAAGRKGVPTAARALSQHRSVASAG